MATVRINTYDQTTGPQGAALPQANIPGNFQIEANAARQFGALGNALRGLAEVEMRMKEAQRVDTLNAARVNYINDIAREQERLGNEDTDYETQRQRYVDFQKERAAFYGSQLDNATRDEFNTSILLPSTEREFSVGQAAMAGLNDRIISNVNKRITDLTSQAGVDHGKDAESLKLIEQELATLVNNKVISQVKANEVFDNAKQSIQVNQLGFTTKTNPQAIVAATRGIRIPTESLSKEGVIGKSSGDVGSVKNSIYDKAVAAGHDPRMMLGIAQAESGFNPKAKSVVDDQGRYAAGLFQFREPAARQVGIMDDKSDRRFDAEANMDGAMKYMDYIASQVPGGRSRPDLMIAAWYQGPHNADIQAGNVPANAVSYVNKVLKYGYGDDGMKGVTPEAAASVDAGNAASVVGGVSSGDYSKDTAPYMNLLAQGYTMQQALHFVDLAEANIAAQQKQAKEQAQLARENYVNATYSKMYEEAVQKIPDMETRHNYMQAYVSTIPDRDMRKEFQSLLDSDVKAETARQNAIDQQGILTVMNQVRENGLSYNRTWAMIENNPEMTKGMSYAGIEKLRRQLIEERPPTQASIAAVGKLKEAIDLGRGELTRDKVLSAAFENDLNAAETNDVMNYYDGGGKMASATYSMVNSEVQRQTKNKDGLEKMPEGFYEEVLALLPHGQKANADTISRAVSKLLTEGEEVVGSLWDTNMNYSEALEEGKGANWLPDLTKEDKLLLPMQMRSAGETDITEHKMRVYKREFVMGLPRYEEAQQKDMTRTLYGPRGIR